jgi:hypothetical protein
MNPLIPLAGVLAVSSMMAQPNTFVLDPARPFVYVKFDHVGSRKPALEGEGARGLWLRLVNNCRLPITVLTFDLGTGDPAAGLNYTVVPAGGMRPARDPEPRRATKMPRGYSSDTGSPARVAPGQDLLFSIPMDHVTEFWHIQLNFDFDLPEPREGVNPRGVVTFYWENIPQKYRAVLDVPLPGIPRKMP